MTTTQQPGQPYATPPGQPSAGAGGTAPDMSAGMSAGMSGGVSDGMSGATAYHAGDAGVAAPPPRPALRRINLLPPEVVAKRKAAQTRVYACIGVAALVVLLAAVFVFAEFDVSAAKQDLADAKAANSVLERQINDKDLQSVVAAKRDLDARIKSLAGSVGSEVSMPRVLLQLMLNLPEGVWLSSVQIATTPAKASGKVTTQAAGEAGASGAAAKTQPTGTVRLTIKGKCGQLSTATYLEQLKKTPAIADAWVSSSTKQKGTTSDSCVDTQVVDVSATAQLSPQSGTQRAQHLQQGDLP